VTSFRLTVPGNLLLAGEYAVLEEGGLGYAVAVEPRLTVTVRPQDRWELVGRWVGGGEQWDPESGVPAPFSGLVFLRALELLDGRGDQRGRRWSTLTRPARLEIDSTGFFDAQGRKRGFGSSAALAAGLTAALARLGGRDVGPDEHQIAVAAHRHAQGGAGSGYDVTVSWYGGAGLFRGGLLPQWEAAQAAVLPPLGLFAGPEAVKTVGSIARYRAWKGADPDAARDFFDASNAAVRALVSAASPSAWCEAWRQARDVGLDVGQRIGSDARLEPPEGQAPDTLVKALGAGNETGVAVVQNDWTNLTRLDLSPEGLRWE